MSAPLSAARLAEIRARVEAATAGPWCTDGAEIYQGAEYEPGLSAWIGETCRADEGDGGKTDAEFVAHAREDVSALLAEVELLHTAYGELQRSLNQCAAELGKAQTDVDADLPRLRADLAAWSVRGRKAEADLKEARVEAAEWKARAQAGPNSEWFLALYEGAAPELFATLAAAKECCDDLAAVSAEGGDWLPEADGVWQQVRTRDLDDAIVGEAPGSVWRLSVQGAVAEAGGR